MPGMPPGDMDSWVLLVWFQSIMAEEYTKRWYKRGKNMRKKWDFLF